MEERVYRIALAGNPNVGKSTVFNALTGLHQHTGNWAGKTVEGAEGCFMFHMKQFQLTDLPGTYSLWANAAEEQAAREFLCQQLPDAVIVVCDACCLERNLMLALQVMELCPRVVLCVNLMDEAAEKGICIDTGKLSELLGVPAVGICARNGEGLELLLQTLEVCLTAEQNGFAVRYADEIEAHLQILKDMLTEENCYLPARWAALRLLEQDGMVRNWLRMDKMHPHVEMHLAELQEHLEKQGWGAEQIHDSMTASIVQAAEAVSAQAVTVPAESDARDRRLDRILLGRAGIPVMLLLLGCILWVTAAGANYPSAALSAVTGRMGEWLRSGLTAWHLPEWCVSLLVDGIFQTTAWVVSVMLPPMAIFFPLFTLLEDAGYLPRAAFLLDRPLRNSGACGKQALTMCMGLGCNACGVTGCRIIDSPRERLTAMLTNGFMPCNGRFPLLMALTAMFLVRQNMVLQAAVLAGMIAFSVGITCAVSAFLSGTLLKGEASAFTLELPPYRIPQFGKTLVRSLLDRTVFVLGRAAAVAAPAGAVIWVAANVHIGEENLLTFCAGKLDPVGAWFGMDGMILLAFLLGLPANEMVLPVLLMGYLSQETLTDTGSLQTMQDILAAHGWTAATALCVMAFSLMHFPCSTTLLTIRKETGSLKWTALAAVLPTVCGLLVCFCIHSISMIL